MTARQLTNAFQRWREIGQPLVLATVYETAGSTYSKAGAQMLINADADFQGMLSGGCLEGDLAERARQVLENGAPQTVTYDLGLNDEQLWGLGVGCDGLMRIFLQPLRKESGYEPFASMLRAYAGDSVQLAATVLESTNSRIKPGSSMVTVNDKIAFSDLDAEFAAAVEALITEAKLAGRSQLRKVQGEVSVLVSTLLPPPRVLVLGGGLDAEPVVRLISELGWRVIVQDHRPAYIAAGNFSDAEKVHCVPAEELVTTVDFSRIDAVIVMSHHLATDQRYLEILASTDVRYIGLLGPPNRRERLVKDLGSIAESLQGRLHGPAGIDIGGTGPAAIALSIVSEMHQFLMR
jgi:xanthine/CO dehydrogenase XdhC/CoxF family maturation factor